jgi:deoxyribodipyrimidine photo-lyase
LDFDLASNNGDWQWAADTGCDADPYFRIFNPTEQTKKFDPQLTYIKKWIPEFNTPNYPTPIINHKIARNRALKFYSQINRQHRNELPL